MNICAIANLDNILKLLDLVNKLIVFLISAYVIWQWRKINQINNKLSGIQEKIDYEEKEVKLKSKESIINQRQLDKLIIEKQKPLKKKLTELKKEKGLILEKTPFLGLIRI